MASRTAQRKSSSRGRGAPTGRSPRVTTSTTDEADHGVIPSPTPWATSDLLGGDIAYEDILLPILKVKVRVRYLDTVEVTRLQMLPDYAGFLELAQEFGRLIAEGGTSLGDEQESKMAEETVRYQKHVAHLAIADPEADLERDEKCMSCEMEHPRSLWTLRQAGRLPSADLDFVVLTALRAEGVVSMRPFSEAPTPPDSPVPADTSQ